MKRHAIILNLKRRHLNEFQLATYGKELSELYKVDAETVKRKQSEAAKKRERNNDNGLFLSSPTPNGVEVDRYESAIEKGAKEAGTSAQKIYKVDAIKQKAIPEILAKAQMGKLKINTAHNIAKLDKQIQKIAVEAIDNGEDWRKIINEKANAPTSETSYIIAAALDSIVRFETADKKFKPELATGFVKHFHKVHWLILLVKFCILKNQFT